MAWLNAKVNFERQPNRDLAIRVLKLDRMRALSAALGDPHLAVPAIHVAGSKGKGSITRMAASILSAAGLRTGAFTSPHLILPNERIAVDRQPVSDAHLAAAILRVKQAEAMLPTGVTARFGSPTYFEAITAAAFDHFAQARCDAAVYEVGLGGRLDSTNIVQPAVCVLASIELEHTDILGHTLADIAREKAGILKPGVPAICTPQPAEVLDAFGEQADLANAPLLVLGRDIGFEHRMDAGHAIIDLALNSRTFTNLRSPMPGSHQAANTAAAVAACALMLGDRLTDAAIVEGLEQTPRDGRMETIATNPTLIVDGAHTPASVRATLSALPAHDGPLVILFGCAKDKDAAGMLDQLAKPNARVVFTQAGPRARPADELAAFYTPEGESFADPAKALERARQVAGPGGLVLVCGSFMLAGAVKAMC
jgi:dihydrofolate synthase/folylpolyglutamate synthase